MKLFKELQYIAPSIGAQCISANNAYQMENQNISIKGARVNNLKNIDIEIPLNKFIVVTGVSGSGKSSLAFDTLYAEGQRRYVESLSAYARQFLGRMSKPECDYIKGLPPAIAIEQKVNTRNPRSTVGTATEIYDYLRMLFARIGHTFSPISGEEVKKHGVDDIVDAIMKFEPGTRFAVLSSIQLPEGRNFENQLDIYAKEGYSRLEHNGEFVDIAELRQQTTSLSPSDYRLLIDRLSVANDKDTISRLADSVETAYFEGHNECIIKVWQKSGEQQEFIFSKKFAADGMEFREPNDLMFNFNNPYGACPECEGFGRVLGISEELVIPNKSLSVYQNAVKCWSGDKMGEWKRRLIHLAPSLNFPIHTPYVDLTQEQKDILWHGKNGWEGIDGFFAWIDKNQEKMQYRVLKARYRGKTTCPTCNGSRLHKDVEYVKICGKSISELVKMSIAKLERFFIDIELSEVDKTIGKRLLTEIRQRLNFLNEVGLGYLTLDRLSSTLSGGESQRINLATSLGSSLVGSLYILDEPSIGLHSRDTERLIRVLRHLQQIGNTVVVVEHDEDIMLEADEIIDIGPNAGRLGGEVVCHGNLKDLLNDKAVSSYTVEYLSGRREIAIPQRRRRWKKFIEIKGAQENNLKNIDVKFPLGIMTVVSGVSGSGKSTLVREILYKGLVRALGEAGDAPGTHKEISGSLSDIGAVEFVDQNPIGTSSRSNPATYLKAFDEIRKLFADQQLARQMDFTPGYFSFNTEGGRCEECKGEGTVTIPMQFMADIEIPCDACHGKRFKQEVLDVEYHGKNIYDFLEMTVNQAIEFLSQHEGSQERRIIKRLLPLQEVGLGYIKLGQSSSTLSGGENQRVKLAYYISQENSKHTMFIFDEPTTGLHFHDISTLLKSLNRLIDKGNTVVIIEHNMDVIKSADWVIDIGPEGGDKGGEVLVAGTPEEVASTTNSYTGKFLKEKLK